MSIWQKVLGNYNPHGDEPDEELSSDGSYQYDDGFGPPDDTGEPPADAADTIIVEPAEGDPDEDPSAAETGDETAPPADESSDSDDASGEEAPADDGAEGTPAGEAQESAPDGAEGAGEGEDPPAEEDTEDPPAEEDTEDVPADEGAKNAPAAPDQVFSWIAIYAIVNNKKHEITGVKSPDAYVRSWQEGIRGISEQQKLGLNDSQLEQVTNELMKILADMGVHRLTAGEFIGGTFSREADQEMKALVLDRLRRGKEKSKKSSQLAADLKAALEALDKDDFEVVVELFAPKLGSKATPQRVLDTIKDDKRRQLILDTIPKVCS